ncbi:hypothetical protein DV736_g3170, partial [Chaetothyriales sp. CBS 134916]
MLAALGALSQQSAAATLQPAALSRPRVPRFDDLYEYYDPEAEARPQRQQLAQSRRGRTQSLNPGILFEQSGSTSPQSFQRLVEDDSYWPQRTTDVSRRTHDAILFALESIRSGRGVDAHSLTPDLIEERARMSDLLRDNGPSGTPLGQVQDGSGQLPPEPPRMRTPRDGDTGRRPGSSRLEPVGPARSYNIAGPPPQAAPLPGHQPDTAVRPQAPLPQTLPQQTVFEPSHARVSSTTQRNRTEALDRLNMTATAQPAAGEPRWSAKPGAPQPATVSNMARPPRPEAQPSAPQPRAGSRFPHAFERWEQLSAQWEGLTSHWLRRLQNNANELEGKPLEQQMARQIADLSAAGANLFHAVVELQRLRASSERKFQRWFFETREEQEQAAERQAELERQLRAERDARLTAQAAGTDAAVRAEKARAEDLVREMRRELQISKEEARRAWEELGRREQEERERTIALRSGEPTLIAPGAAISGQQLPNPSVPPPSRTTSTSLDSPGEEARQFSYQPQPASSSSTDPFTEASASQQPSLGREDDPEFYALRAAHQSTAAAAASASSIHRSPPSNLPAATNGHSAASRFYQQPSPQTTIHQPLGTLPTTTAPTGLPSQHHRPSTASDTGGSYHPSSTSLLSGEEEYHINPDGSYTLDSSGRRIPYSQPLVEEYSAETELIGEIPGQAEEESDEDYASDIAREQAYAQEYASPTRRPVPPFPPQHQQQQTPSLGTPSTPPQHSSPSHLPSSSGPHVSSSQATSATTAYLSAEQADPSTPSHQRYDAGWEDVPLSTSRHRHPTRLSDIIEEQTSRTSPSRGSYISGSAAGAPR